MKYDTIIVGAGVGWAAYWPTGCRKTPARSVLLLEAGPDYLSEHLPAELKYDMNQSASLEGGLHNWSLRAQAASEQGRSVHFPRGRGDRRQQRHQPSDSVAGVAGGF